MHWILQSNLFNESAFASLIEQLERQGQSFDVTAISKGEMLDPIREPAGPIIALGAIAMGKIAQARGWIPGRFDDNLDYETLATRYGSLMLNHGARFAKLSDAHLTAPDGPFFIRPCLDSKLFSGMLLGSHNDLKSLVAKVPEHLRGERVAIAAPCHDIKAEYRFFVIDGAPITGCLYKLGQSVLYSDRIDQSVWDFARMASKHYSPNRAYALDLAESNQGLHVLEINAINSAGFYALDMGKFVHAIASMDFTHELSDAKRARSSNPPRAF